MPMGLKSPVWVLPKSSSRACHRKHDLVVIDVGAGRLPEVLYILRSSARHSGISVLVEAGRVLTEPSLVGVLPKYRAMPCSRSRHGEAGAPPDNWRRLPG